MNNGGLGKRGYIGIAVRSQIARNLRCKVKFAQPHPYIKLTGLEEGRRLGAD